MFKSRTLTISINHDPKTVYEFVSNPESFPIWASTAFRSIKRVNGDWIVETPQGPAKISMAEKNRFGVLDHFVKTSRHGNICSYACSAEWSRKRGDIYAFPDSRYVR